MDLHTAFFSHDLVSEIVDGPVGRVLVKSLTVDGKDRIQSAAIEGMSYRPVVLRECMYDPASGEPVFGKDEDVGKIPADVAEPYINAALRLSAVARSEVEELEGNSDRTPSNATASS